MSISFTITLYGSDEHAERNTAQHLWHALEKEHAKHAAVGKFSAMLIGEAKYEPIVERR